MLCKYCGKLVTGESRCLCCGSYADGEREVVKLSPEELEKYEMECRQAEEERIRLDKEREEKEARAENIKVNILSYTGLGFALFSILCCVLKVLCAYVFMGLTNFNTMIVLGNSAGILCLVTGIIGAILLMFAVGLRGHLQRKKFWFTVVLIITFYATGFGGVMPMGAPYGSLEVTEGLSQVYHVGDQIDMTNVKFKAVCDENGKTEIINASDYEIIYLINDNNFDNVVEVGKLYVIGFDTSKVDDDCTVEFTILAYYEENPDGSGVTRSSYTGTFQYSVEA